MGMREVIELPKARIEVEERPGYLFVVESGQLTGLADLKRYISTMERVVDRTGVGKALIDARAEIGDPPASVREGMWHWLTSARRGFTSVAFVLPTEMAVARVNMTALSKAAPIRAFDTVFAAQRWLTRSARTSTYAGLEASPSSRPPPPSSIPRTEAHVSSTPAERRGAPERPEGGYRSSPPNVEQPMGRRDSPDDGAATSRRRQPTPARFMSTGPGPARPTSRSQPALDMGAHRAPRLGDDREATSGAAGQGGEPGEGDGGSQVA